MPALIGSLYVSLTANFNEYRQSMEGAERTTARTTAGIRRNVGLTEKSVGGLHRQMSHGIRPSALIAAGRSFDTVNSRANLLRGSVFALTAAFGGLGAALISNVIARYMDSFTQLENQMRVVSSSSGDLAAKMGAVQAVANRSRASLSAVATLYSRIAKASPGIAPTDLLRRVETINKALQLGGATAQEAASAAIQFSQAIASNRLGGEELRAVLETPLGLELAKGIGVTIGQFRQMGYDGKLTADVLFKALDKISKSIDTQFLKSVMTIDQALTQADNKITAYAGSLDDAYGITRLISASILGFANNLETIIPLLATVAGGIGALFAGRLVGGMGERAFNSVRGGIVGVIDARKEEMRIAREALELSKSQHKEALKAASAAQLPLASGNVAGLAPRGLLKEYARDLAAVQKADENHLRILDQKARATVAIGEIYRTTTGGELRAANLIAEAEGKVNQTLRQRSAIRGQMTRASKLLDLYPAPTGKTPGFEVLAKRESIFKRQAELAVQMGKVEQQLEKDRAGVASRNAKLLSETNASFVKAANERAKIIIREKQLTDELVASDEKRRQLETKARASKAGVQTAGTEAASKALGTATQAANATEVSVRRAGSAFSLAASGASRMAIGLGIARTAGLSLVGFLGGPWGVAFTTAIAALTLFGIRSAEAAEKEQRFQEILKQRVAARAEEGSKPAKLLMVEDQRAAVLEQKKAVEEGMAAATAAVDEYIDHMNATTADQFAFMKSIKATNDEFKLGGVTFDDFIKKMRAIGDTEGIVEALEEVGQTVKNSKESLVSINAELKRLDETIAGKRGAFVDSFSAMAEAGKVASALAYLHEQLKSDALEDYGSQLRKLTKDFLKAGEAIGLTADQATEWAKKELTRRGIFPRETLTKRTPGDIREAMRNASLLKRSGAAAFQDAETMSELSGSNYKGIIDRARDLFKDGLGRSWESAYQQASAEFLAKHPLELGPLDNPLLRSAPIDIGEFRREQQRMDLRQRIAERSTNVRQGIFPRSELETRNASDVAEAQRNNVRLAKLQAEAVGRFHAQLKDSALGNYAAQLKNLTAQYYEQGQAIGLTIELAQQYAKQELIRQGVFPQSVFDARTASDVAEAQRNAARLTQSNADAAQRFHQILKNDSLNNYASQLRNLTYSIYDVGKAFGVTIDMAQKWAQQDLTRRGVLPEDALKGGTSSDRVEALRNAALLEKITGRDQGRRRKDMLDEANETGVKALNTAFRIKQKTQELLNQGDLFTGPNAANEAKAFATELLNIAEAQRLANKETRDGANEYERFANKLKELKETGKAAWLSELDRKVVDFAKSLKDGAPLMNQYIDAVTSGDLSKAPKELLEARDAFREIGAAESWHQIIQQYGTGVQITGLLAEKQAELNIMVARGGITAEQASLAYADFIGQFQDYKWIDQVSSAISGFAESAILDFENIEDSFKNMVKQLGQIALKALIFEPFERMLRGTLANFTGTGGQGAAAFSGAGIGAAVADAVAPAIARSVGGAGAFMTPVVNVAKRAVTGTMGVYRQAIKNIESSGGNYSALGPIIKKTGDRAYGAYQIMGENIPSWTKAATGKAMTPGQFLMDRGAQDATFDHRFGGYVNKYGASGAAQAWIGGPGSVGGSGRGADPLGTTGNSYVQQFNEHVKKLGGATQQAAGGLSKVAAVSASTVEGLGGFAESLAKFAQSAAGGGGAGGWFSNLGSKFGGFGGAFNFMNSISPLATKGILGGVIGGLYHDGGDVGRGIPRFHGGMGHKEFLAMLERGEKVLTAEQSGRTMGLIGGMTNRMSTGEAFAPVYNIDARGADVGAVARLESGLYERDRRFAGNVAAANKKGRTRRIFR